MQQANSPVTVIIADDHSVVREGFTTMMKKFPEIKVVGEAADGVELIALAKRLKPNVVMADVKMPNMDGIEATKILTAELPETGVIALSMFDDISLILDMLDAGARGYLLKNAHKDEMVSAIKAASVKESYYSPEVTQLLTKNVNYSSKIPLNKKEIEIIKLLCKQYSSKQIAGIVHLEKTTVNWYRNQILQKLDVQNTSGIVMYAAKNNIC